jgi:hypothetical protein
VCRLFHHQLLSRSVLVYNCELKPLNFVAMVYQARSKKTLHTLDFRNLHLDAHSLLSLPRDVMNQLAIEVLCKPKCPELRHLFLWTGPFHTFGISATTLRSLLQACPKLLMLSTALTIDETACLDAVVTLIPTLRIKLGTLHVTIDLSSNGQADGERLLASALALLQIPTISTFRCIIDPATAWPPIALDSHGMLRQQLLAPRVDATPLLTLDFAKYALSPADAMTVAEFLASPSCRAQSVCIACNDDDALGAIWQSLQRNTSIQSFMVLGAHQGERVKEGMRLACASNSTLLNLRLFDAPMPLSAVESLMAALRGRPSSILPLDLGVGQSHLDDQHLQAIAQFVEEAPVCTWSECVELRETMTWRL